MARLAGVIFTSHAWIDTPPEQWDQVRATRHHREDVPRESDAVKHEKAARIRAGTEVLRNKIDEMDPDVLVIFGDDQYECFNFDNLPSLAVYAGDEFAGRTDSGTRPGVAPHPAYAAEVVPGHPALARAMLTGLLQRGFDPAFSLGMPEHARGMAHAIMNPLRLFGRTATPTLPLLINAYYAPQMRARRCYELGRAVRQVLDEYPEDLRIVVIGSGGLWHTPRRERAYLDESFDLHGLSLLKAGEILAWADFFDGYKVPADDPSQDISGGETMTGLPSLGGPQMGTRETCNWIGAAAVVDGRPSVVVDYVPVYASPIGVAFAYCDEL